MVRVSDGDVTSFTVAHSITLIASAYDAGPDSLWFPPLIETLIAISIVYMALENIAGVSNAQRRWMIAFAFGLVHPMSAPARGGSAVATLRVEDILPVAWVVSCPGNGAARRICARFNMAPPQV